MITSCENKWIKMISALKTKKERDKQGLFVAEGSRFVDEIPADVDIELFAVSEDYYNENSVTHLESRARTLILGDAAFKKCCDTKNPQGVLAVCKKNELTAEYVLNNVNAETGFFIFADRIADPGNLGSIIRTADAAGADAVFVSEGSVDIYNGKTLRSTMGSVFHIDIVENSSPGATLSLLKSRGAEVYGAHLDGGRTLYELDLRKGFVFVIGSEAEGMSAEAASLCSGLVKIPMRGMAESLNASVASGIIMFEAVRQRLGGSYV